MVAALGLLSAVAVLLLRGGCAGKTNGSLCYYYLEVSEPSQKQPRFFIRSYLDDQPIARYNNLTRKMEPLVSWVKEVEKEGFLAPKRVFDADLKKLSKLNHPTEGFHTWLAILGCELREDGSKGVFFRYGYDGMNFITFENETLKWMAPQPQAEKIKQMLEENPQWSRRNKDYLEKNCIEWLQTYLSYRNKTLECTEPPVGKLTLKVVNDSQELICQGFGFYPKEIQANWTRDGEVCQNETVPRNVTPNSDGTYYVRLSIEIDPKEKDRFQCHLNCEGLQKPLILSLKEETAGSPSLATGWRIPVGIVGGLISGAVILFLICKYWRGGNQKAKSSLEDSPSEMVSLPRTSGREERERQLNSSPQSEITLEDRASNEGGSSEGAVEDSGSTVMACQRPAQIVADPNEEEAGGVLRQQPVQPALESDSEEAEEDVPEAGIQPGPSEPPEAPSSEESEAEEPLPNAQACRATKKEEGLLRKRSPRE